MFLRKRRREGLRKGDRVRVVNVAIPKWQHLIGSTVKVTEVSEWAIGIRTDTDAIFATAPKNLTLERI